ncbi:MAG TPA: iron-sulfur cluster carrier protein MrpORP [bacterium]|nr:iron-sulfur cluster carrier protein MrpORP [bacterium]
MGSDGKCGHGGGGCSSGNEHQGGGRDEMNEFLDNQLLSKRMSMIKNKIIVMSGKGGVGKSTVAANIAVGLAMRGLRVGLLDVDIHGPSVPRLLGLADARPDHDEFGLKPVECKVGDAVLRVMSIGFLTSNRDEAIIWRGPMKMTAIKQFLKDVAWGELDFLVIDSPPGTGDEPLSVCQLIPGLTGAVIVTTPQKLAIDDVRKSIAFCNRLNLRVLGVVENMSGFVCPKCGETIDVFKSGGGQEMASDMGVPFLGKVPLDPAVVAAGDDGSPVAASIADGPTAAAFSLMIEPLLTLVNNDGEQIQQKEGAAMRIAIPTAQGSLCMHFGHCEVFTIFDVEDNKVVKTQTLTPPEHEPGVIPKWLSEQKATHIIAGGMGSRAQDLFKQYGIEVVVGAPALAPQNVVEQYLSGSLQCGGNVCDH